MRVNLKHKEKMIQDLKDELNKVKKQQEPLQTKLSDSIRFSMSLRNEIQNLTEKIQRFDKHATIERYNDRTTEQELDAAHREIYNLQEAMTKVELEKGFLT